MAFVQNIDDTIDKFEFPLKEQCPWMTYKIIIYFATFIVGLLLCFIGKPFMRITISSLIGLTAGFAVYQCRSLAGSNITENIWIVICILSGLLSAVLAFKFFVKRIGIPLLNSIVFGALFYVASVQFLITQINDPWFNYKAFGSIVIGVIIGLIIGCAQYKATTKVIAAIFGSFLVVSSAGSSINAFGGDLKFDLKNLFGTAEGFVTEHTLFLAKMAGDSVGKTQVPSKAFAEDINKMDIVMCTLWIVVCIFSLIYQFVIRKS